MIFDKRGGACCAVVAFDDLLAHWELEITQGVVDTARSRKMWHRHVQTWIWARKYLVVFSLDNSIDKPCGFERPILWTWKAERGKQLWVKNRWSVVRDFQAFGKYSKCYGNCTVVHAESDGYISRKTLYFVLHSDGQKSRGWANFEKRGTVHGLDESQDWKTDISLVVNIILKWVRQANITVHCYIGNDRCMLWTRSEAAVRGKI